MSTNTNTLLNFVEKIHELREQYKDPKQSFHLLKAGGDALLKLSPEGTRNLLGEGLAPFLAEESNYRGDIDPNGFFNFALSKPWRETFRNIHLSLHLFPPRAEKPCNAGELHYHPHGDGFISRTLDGYTTHQYAVLKAAENGSYDGYFRLFDSYEGSEPRVQKLGRFNITANSNCQVAYYPTVSEQSRVRDLCLMTTSPVHKVTTDENNYTATLMLTPNRTANGQKVYLPHNQRYEQSLPQNRQIVSPEALRQIISRIPIFNS
jgi:hypothetical protein